MEGVIPTPPDQLNHRISDATLAEPNIKTASTVPLRVKGFLAFSAVVLYAVLITYYTLHKKNELSSEFEHLQNLYMIEDQLRQVEDASLHVAMAVFINTENDTQERNIQRFQENFSLVQKKNADLKTLFPSAGLNLFRINSAIKQALLAPQANSLAIINTELLKAKNIITQHIKETRQQQKKTANYFHTLWDSAALAALMFGIFGLILLGTIIGLFFTRLTGDLLTVKTRALDIVNGDRSNLIPVNRDDEVGELMQAVNHMALTLDEREKELVITRQRYFHQEKMAAIGSLAAGVAHEIGNPIAAMSGVLQEMTEPIYKEKISLLQTQIQRLSTITREISGFASPQPMERQLLDLNGLIRSTSALMSYDKRMRNVKMKFELDSQLPAIYAISDQLTQVIMNLLINAADALSCVTDRSPEIVIRTETRDNHAILSVTDSGCGMNTDVLDRALEAFFTTKRSEGTGLGLALCHSIINGHGGNINIDSKPNIGTKISISLPLPSNDEEDTL
jgi:signal transduction histidine kinase